MSNTPENKDELKEKERIEVLVRVAASLNIAAATFLILSAAMVMYNIYSTKFSSSNEEFATAIAVLMMFMATPYLFLGIGLLMRFRIARFASILIGFIHLLEIPVGTPIGIFMLWLFLTQDTDSYFGKDTVPDLAIYSDDD